MSSQASFALHDRHSANHPDLHVVDPDGVVHQKAEPALHRMREAFRAMLREQLVVDAQAHFIALGDENEFVPFGVGFIGNIDALGLQQCFQISGDLLLLRHRVVTALAIF